MPMSLSGGSQRQEGRILALMRSPDPRAIKNGIQNAYEYLRVRRPTSSTWVHSIRYELSKQLGTQDPFITPWIYSLIAALGDAQYEPYLRSQLKNHEFDPVNRTWAVASLARVAEDYRQVLQEINDDHTLPYQLAAAMYRGNLNDARAVRGAADSDDRLAHLWVTLLFSEQRAEIPVAQVRELTASRDAEVAQYALFALHKHPGTGIESVTIGPQDLRNVQPRVRRWFYQLLLKDPTNLDRYGAAVQEWIDIEVHTQAREGLAKAFTRIQPSREWIHQLRSWAESETDPYVLDALRQIPSVADITRMRREEQTGDGKLIQYTVSKAGNIYYVSADSFQVTQHNNGQVIAMDIRDQSVNVSGSGNTIGSVQGAYSVAETHQVVRLENPLVEAAPRLVELLIGIADALSQEETRGEEAQMLDLIAQDIQQDAAASDGQDETRISRLKARFKQASMALTMLAGATAGANELITQAKELIGSVT